VDYAYYPPDTYTLAIPNQGAWGKSLQGICFGLSYSNGLLATSTSNGNLTWAGGNHEGYSGRSLENALTRLSNGEKVSLPFSGPADLMRGGYWGDLKDFGERVNGTFNHSTYIGAADTPGFNRATNLKTASQYPFDPNLTALNKFAAKDGLQTAINVNENNPLATLNMIRNDAGQRAGGFGGGTIPIFVIKGEQGAHALLFQSIKESGGISILRVFDPSFNGRTEQISISDQGKILSSTVPGYEAGKIQGTGIYFIPADKATSQTATNPSAPPAQQPSAPDASRAYQYNRAAAAAAATHF